MADTLWEYAVSLFYHYAIAVGIVLVVALKIGENRKGWKLNKTLLGSILTLGFLTSSFLAWREEYHKSHPGLSISLEEIGFVEGLTASQGPAPRQYFASAAFVTATVRNLGSDKSVADSYALTILVPGRKDLMKPVLLGLNMPDDAVINMSNDKISMSKALYKETRTPIETGDQKQGILFFIIQGEQNTLQYLNQDGTTFVLTCKDVSGNTITSPPAKLKGVNEGHRHYIGLE